MRIAHKKRFYAGFIIAIFLLISYFIKFQEESGTNYQTSDTLLGFIIFHNLIIFTAYLIVALFLIVTGWKNIKFT